MVMVNLSISRLSHVSSWLSPNKALVTALV